MRTTISLRSFLGLWFTCAVAAVLAAVGTLLLRVPVVEASSFGTRAFVYKKHGSEVDILVPSLSPSPAEGEFVLHRVVVQDDYYTNAGLVQSGLYLSSPTLQLDNCGTRSNWTYYTEYKVAGQPNEVSYYKCHLFQTGSPGENTLHSVYHKAANVAEWNAEQNFTVVGTYKPGFETGYPAVGGEIQRAGGAPPAFSHTSALYANAPVWSSFNSPAKGGWFPITTPSNTILYGNNEGWTVPNVPTPFTISH